MKGYKGMSKDMTCRGMQYEVGKTYHVDGEIALCHSGLHFCERLKDVFAYYHREKGGRYFEVEAGGQIVSGNCKSAASELTIIRELTELEVNRCIYGNGYGDGYGYGYGNGCGDGCGYGNGYGRGYGDGDDYGYGDGDGDGYGNGNGDGYGNGYGLSKISRILIFKGE